MNKVCTKCGEVKTLLEFGSRKGRNRPPGDTHAECKSCGNKRRTDRYKAEPAFREKVKAACNRDYQQLRAGVLSAYGGKCSCCGEKEPKFLSIDHINNEGAEHRRKIGDGAKILCNFLKREGYPPGYAILCFNCNCAKGFYGICPHQTLDTQKKME